VVDGVFGPISAHRLELELMHVHQSGLMHLNHTHLVANGETQLLAKSQVHHSNKLALSAQQQQQRQLANFGNTQLLCKDMHFLAGATIRYAITDSC
jgi:hypothetical protein